jgi:hypothetical protein
MSYTKKHLMSGETIGRETHLHWKIYVPAMIFFALSILLFAVVFSGGQGTKAAMPVPMVFHRTPYKGIAGPLKFRMAVQEQIERSISQTNAPGPQPPGRPKTIHMRHPHLGEAEGTASSPSPG